MSSLNKVTLIGRVGKDPNGMCFEKIKKRILNNVIVNENDCWIWKGNPTDNGYCRTSFNYKSWYIHRMSYYAFVEDCVNGMDICHKCDNRRCCNPKHLFQGTRTDNVQDCINKGRFVKEKKIKGEKLDNVLKMLSSGMKHKDIAQHFDVSRSCISCIYRKNFKNGAINA
jgi:hypothetical protein